MRVDHSRLARQRAGPGTRDASVSWRDCCYHLVMPHLRSAITRMEAEYQEMPGLVLTRREAERLLGLDRATCERALEALMRRRFLKRLPTGAYLRNRPG